MSGKRRTTLAAPVAAKASLVVHAGIRDLNDDFALTQVGQIDVGQPPLDLAVRLRDLKSSEATHDSCPLTAGSWVMVAVISLSFRSQFDQRLRSRFRRFEGWCRSVRSCTWKETAPSRDTSVWGTDVAVWPAAVADFVRTR